MINVVKFTDETVGKGIRERLRLAINANSEIPKGHGRTAAVALLLGEGHQTVRLWTAAGKGQRTGLPNISRIPNLAKKLGVNVAWLIAGEGTMLCKDNIDKDTVNAEILSTTWRLMNKEFSSVDINAQDNELMGDILLHVYEMVSAHDYKEPPSGGNADKILAFERKTLEKIKKAHKEA